MVQMIGKHVRTTMGALSVVAAGVFGGPTAHGQPTIVESGFQIEEFVAFSEDVFPLALAVPPVGSDFGDFLYFASADLTLVHGPSNPPDPIMRIDMSTREASNFFDLPSESDPGWIKFGPGDPFSTNLYVSSNNRDGGQPNDQGGSIVFLEPDPQVNGEQFLTPVPPPTVLSEPRAIAFGPGGGFGTDLFVVNTDDAPTFDIARIAPDGTRSTFISVSELDTVSVTSLRVFGMEISGGGPFGTNLYLSDSLNGRIIVIDENGDDSEFASIPGFSDPDILGAIAFAPDGPFGEDMYVTAQMNGDVSVFRINPDGDVTEIANGFEPLGDTGGGFSIPTSGGLAFSNDGQSLFVADNSGHAIYRITVPEPTTLMLLAIGGLGLARRRVA